MLPEFICSYLNFARSATITDLVISAFSMYVQQPPTSNLEFVDAEKSHEYTGTRKCFHSIPLLKYVCGCAFAANNKGSLINEHFRAEQCTSVSFGCTLEMFLTRLRNFHVAKMPKKRPIRMILLELLLQVLLQLVICGVQMTTVVAVCQTSRV